MQEYGFSLQSAALLAACFSLPGGVLRAIGGWMSDKWGAHSVTWWVMWVSWVCLFILSYPQTDFTVHTVNGPQTLHRLPEMIDAARTTKTAQVDISFPEIEKFDHLPEARVDGPSAFVSVMEGCSKYCTFCVVPYTRGEEVSRPLADVLLEITQLARFFRGFHESLRTGRLDGLSASTAWTLFACHLLRRHGERTGERPSPLPSVGRVRSFLEENMDRNVSLEELASLVSASPWHLLRAFRRETGLPPHAYQIQLRIREAQRKLLAGTAPVQVAAEVGFADQSHLTRWFRRIVGTTPAAFLRDTGSARGTGPFPADDGPRTRSEGAPSPRREVALEPSSEPAGEEG